MLFALFQKLAIYCSVLFPHFLPTPWFSVQWQWAQLQAVGSDQSHSRQSCPSVPGLAGSYGLTCDPTMASHGNMRSPWCWSFGETLVSLVVGTCVAGSDLAFIPPPPFMASIVSASPLAVLSPCVHKHDGNAWNRTHGIWSMSYWINASKHLAPEFLPCEERNPLLSKLLHLGFRSVQFSSVARSCPTLCDPMNRSMPGLPVHHQLPEFTQTHVHRVSDAI